MEDSRIHAVLDVRDEPAMLDHILVRMSQDVTSFLDVYKSCVDDDARREAIIAYLGNLDSYCPKRYMYRDNPWVLAQGLARIEAELEGSGINNDAKNKILEEINKLRTNNVRDHAYTPSDLGGVNVFMRTRFDNFRSDMNGILEERGESGFDIPLSWEAQDRIARFNAEISNVLGPLVSKKEGGSNNVEEPIFEDDGTAIDTLPSDVDVPTLLSLILSDLRNFVSPKFWLDKLRGRGQ